MSLLGKNVGGALESEVSRSYNSFSGSDIRAVIGQYQFAAASDRQLFGHAREDVEAHGGFAGVRSFSRNKRGIAGSLIWINFDRHGLLSLVHKMRGKYIANVDDIRPQFRTEENAFLSQNAVLTRCFAAGSRTLRARAREAESGGCCISAHVFVDFRVFGNEAWELMQQRGLRRAFNVAAGLGCWYIPRQR